MFIVLLMPFTAESFCFNEAGEYYGIKPELLMAISKRESNIDPRAFAKNKNGSVDIGLMQINSFWFDKLGDDKEYLLDPCFNVYFGAYVLADCINRFGYTWDCLACYRSGKPLRKLSPKTKKSVISYIKDIQRHFNRYSEKK